MSQLPAFVPVPVQIAVAVYPNPNPLAERVCPPAPKKNVIARPPLNNNCAAARALFPTV